MIVLEAQKDWETTLHTRFQRSMGPVGIDTSVGQLAKQLVAKQQTAGSD